MGLGQFADSRGGLGKKEGGGVFEGGGANTPMPAMKLLYTSDMQHTHHFLPGKDCIVIAFHGV